MDLSLTFLRSKAITPLLRAAPRSSRVLIALHRNDDPGRVRLQRRRRGDDRALYEGDRVPGIVDMGYRYDARDGQYKLLDVNPRIAATFRLFVGTNGIDVARAFYLDLTGQQVEMAGAREGRKWLVESYDTISSLRYLRDRRLTPTEWLRSSRGVDEGAWLALDGPLPFAVICLRLLLAHSPQKLSQTLARPARGRRLGG
jgi:hypothetical protein